MMEALSSSETSVLTKPHGVTSQKTPFFIATAVKTSNLTKFLVVKFAFSFLFLLLYASSVYKILP
jgi:hypothetical protein